ncbi:translocation/assembly module TamB domain-containing protein [Maritimibacter sp. DP1N21-5]|uniref:translocation/assembly module TamB domain-containing protein n=1 Tax=Maritimibacter sp. DP1N21-5 TaxID=2836867 RepID=UPI001C43E2D8|nr:translocation/assembly module TamB domain-containing protein [Maritimibacter sp. DP1N21-5]MBV7410840.1 translocation/assembly module TamB domain-containing protein [Maritimibacter sp. DP1N21-5]
MRRFLSLLALLTVLPLTALAQEETTQEAEDKSRIERFLQDTLSSAGTQVTVTGFSGALSREATMAEMTFADEDGVWLRLAGVTLNWNRAAVLAGRFEVRELAATEIDVSRLPQTDSGPSAEASDFTLPDLPVSIDIGRIAAERVILGEPILGEEVEFTLEGSGNLANGAGEAQIGVTRTDGSEGELALDVSYSNETRVLALDLALHEGPGGIAATLIGLPGEPDIDLTVEGNDPLSDFTANIILATEGQQRVAGQVSIEQIEEQQGGETRRRTGFAADLSGDLRPLFDEQYRDFFGESSVLHAEGARFPNGTTRIRDLFVKTEVLELSGNVAVNARGWPERANLVGDLVKADGSPVLLPLSGAETYVDAARVRFDYDVLRGERWTGSAEVSGFERDGNQLESLSVAGAGRLSPGGGEARPSVNGNVSVSAGGIALADEVLTEVIGGAINGSFRIAKGDNSPFRFTDVAIAGPDYGLTGDVTLDTDVEKLDLLADLDLRLQAGDLARFAPLANLELAGAADLGIAGNVAVPGGPFDLIIEGETRDLDLGIEILDGLLNGRSTLAIAVDRDQERTRISRFTLAAPGVGADVSGELRSDGSRVEARIDLPDASRVDPRLTGQVLLVGSAVQTGRTWAVDATATGPGGLDATIQATAENTRDGIGPVTADVVAALTNLAPYSGLAGQDLSGGLDFVANASGDLRTQAVAVTGSAKGANLGLGMGEVDRLIGGASSVDFDIARDADGTIIVNRLVATTPELSVNATGNSAGGTSTVDFDARLNNVGILVPGLPGAFSASGEAVLSADNYSVDISGTGPGGMTVAVNGTVASDVSTANLSIDGTAPLALANSFISPNTIDGMARFELGLNGPLALTSLSGSVNVPASNVALPNLRVALQGLAVNVTLGNGSARVEAAAAVSSGGRIEVAGPVSLSNGYSGDLVVRLQNVGLTDPALYDTAISGQLTVSGPLTGGATIAGTISAGTVEIRIPSSGFGVAGDLEGLRHVNEPAAVRATRARANKLDTASGSGGGASYNLDITLNAPNQVFIRGRGLDAELGGQLRIGGTTQNVVPQGALSLIRGRLQLLGNRLDLTEASATLQGDFNPYIRVVAQTTVDEVSIQIILEGFATSPDVTFASTPDLPEDEILSRLIFGRSVADISPLQALRLANGVATLSGRSGAGVIGNLRQGFSLSDLDVGTNDDGALAVRAGTYISENVYTGVEVGADGTAEVNINLDLTPNLTARGSVGTDGNTTLGIYFERDY